MEKKKYDLNKYRYNAGVALTKPEGEIIKSQIEKYNCENLSQLMKLIAHGDLVILNKEILSTINKTSERDIDQTILNRRINNILIEYNYKSLDDLQDDIEKYKKYDQ